MARQNSFWCRLIEIETALAINVIYCFDKNNDVAAQIVFCQISAAPVGDPHVHHALPWRLRCQSGNQAGSGRRARNDSCIPRTCRRFRRRNHHQTNRRACQGGRAQSRCLVSRRPRGIARAFVRRLTSKKNLRLPRPTGRPVRQVALRCRKTTTKTASAESITSSRTRGRKSAVQEIVGYSKSNL